MSNEYESVKDVIDETLPGHDLLDDDAGSEVSETFCDQMVELMAHNPRVDEERNGDSITKQLALDPDLDPVLFVDELKGLSKVDIILSYSVGQEDDISGSETDMEVNWATLDGYYFDIIMHQGQPPVATTYRLDEELQHKDEHSDDITRDQSFKLFDVLRPVEAQSGIDTHVDYKKLGDGE